MVHFLHASFPDFLLDASRSKEYYINHSLAYADLAQIFLHHLRPGGYSKDCLRHCLPSIRPCGECTTLSTVSTDLLGQLKQAEPTAELRRALLKTSIIPFLLLCGEFNPEVSMYSYRDITRLLAFLKTSKFTNTEELYLYHRNTWDKTIQEKLKDFQLDVGLIFCLVLMQLDVNPENISYEDYLAYFRSDHTGKSYWDLVTHLSTAPSIKDGYCALLRELLTDPSRAGEYILDGAKYALVAKFLLDCFIRPALSQQFEYTKQQKLPPNIYLLKTVLSKASYSEELIATIRHNDLLFITRHHYYANDEAASADIARLQSLITDIGNYLMRVLGSVPNGLRIIYEDDENGEKYSYYYNIDSV